nr:MAG: replication associated protein [Cressdnaviricota sp.]
MSSLPVLPEVSPLPVLDVPRDRPVGRHIRGDRRQGVFWCFTLPADPPWVPCLPEGMSWLKGQRETGEGGYEHWQLVGAFTKKVSLKGARGVFGINFRPHCELSRSEAANDYVWKEDSRIEETQFEFGSQPIRVNASVDWEHVWTAAKSGDLMSIPARIRVVSYRTIRAIAAANDSCGAIVRKVMVFWGPTGTGKSRRAWDEGGLASYCKDPRTKFWCGYQGEENVIIDEFRGGIDISHLLRWTDRYPVRVEVKGSSMPLVASTIWITSNLDPRNWYPDIDYQTRDALMRRLEITEFT